MVLMGGLLMLLLWWEYYRIFFMSYDLCGNVDGLWLLPSILPEVMVQEGYKKHLAELGLVHF